MPADTFIAPQCNQQIELLYEDEHLLLIDKPSGLLSLSGKNPLNKDSVYERMLVDYPQAKMIHRLDFGTSGIMVLALSCLLYTSPSPRDLSTSRMPSSA